MTLIDDLVVRHAVRGAMVATVLNAVGMPLELLIGRNVRGFPVWAPLASSVVGACLLALLIACRRVATVRLASAVFLVNAAVVLAELWATGAAYAASGFPGAPFQEDKLAILIIAMLAPELAVGFVAILAHVVVASARFAALPDAVRAHLDAGQVWIVVAYAVAGAILLAYRLRSQALQMRVIRADSDATAARRVARVLLAARDLANTPLQTLEFSTSLLRSRHPELEGILARIDRAVSRLRDLGAIFGAAEERVDWAPGDESFDPKTVAAPQPRTAPVRRGAIGIAKRSPRTSARSRRSCSS